MKLVRYHHPLTDSFGDLDRWFRSPLDGFGRLFELANRVGVLPTGTVSHFGVDLYEDDGNYFAKVELPGVKKEDLNVELHEHQLTVSCERRVDSESKESAGESVLKRVFTVPEGIDGEKVSAKLEDGILTVTLPKSPERKPRQISVN
ncbi:MAG: Hsp20/alpha crystallin family protein [Verrucomicrobiae bacterium]|nr:Hsp20/alpha crystallin family protein [Verrucomicrobiae bacterium]